MGCGVYWQQVHEAESALATMDRLGLGPGTVAYDTVEAKRGELISHIGQKFPRIDYSLSMWEDFSPSRVRVWMDPEFGFNAEVRETPGGPPTYKMISAATAVAIIKKEISPELKAWLMAPDEYYGE